MALLIRAEEMVGRISIEEAVAAVREGFRDQGEAPAFSAPRLRIHHEDRRVSVHPGGCHRLAVAGMFIHVERFSFEGGAQQYTGAGKRVYVAGMPRFEQGDEVVLFLAGQTASALTPTVGMWQGVFYVDRDAATGVATVVDHQHRPVIAVRDGRLMRAAGKVQELSQPALSLDEFFQEVERYRATGLAASQ